jgi:hypothetical protein
MKAKLLEITQKQRRSPLDCVAPADFAARPVADVDAQVLLSNPLITLYCLDPARRSALFVETPPDVDLTEAPFFYQAQYEQATRAYEISWQALHALADSVALDLGKVVLVYSVGRTGSTLVSAALNALEGVVGIAEPDVFTQLVAMRDFDGSNTEEIGLLVRSCLRLQCKPTAQVPAPAGWVLKLRSFGIELGDLFHRYCPGTKNLFLYRDLASWMQSAGRAFAAHDDEIALRESLQAALSAVVPFVAKHIERQGTLLSLTALGAHAWLATMERYLELHAEGVPLLALRYSDLTASPREALLALIGHCGFMHVDMKPVYAALARDSQEGSSISREALAGRTFTLGPEGEAELAQLLAARPVIRSGAFTVPSTWIPPD